MLKGVVKKKLSGSNIFSPTVKSIVHEVWRSNAILLRVQNRQQTITRRSEMFQTKKRAAVNCVVVQPLAITLNRNSGKNQSTVTVVRTSPSFC